MFVYTSANWCILLCGCFIVAASFTKFRVRYAAAVRACGAKCAVVFVYCKSACVVIFCGGNLTLCVLSCFFVYYYYAYENVVFSSFSNRNSGRI